MKVWNCVLVRGILLLLLSSWLVVLRLKTEKPKERHLTSPSFLTSVLQCNRLSILVAFSSLMWTLGIVRRRSRSRLCTKSYFDLQAKKGTAQWFANSNARCNF